MFNFIIDCTDSSLEEYLKIDVREGVSVFTKGDLNWCLQTYLILSKQNNLPIKCSNKFCDQSINIIHSDQLLNIKGSPSQFVVCVRADYPKRRWAHYQIVQNKKQLESYTSYIPHWVQPGLIKRDENRQGVKRVAYAGETFNGNLAGSVETWKEIFRPYNIEFINLAPGSWHNLREVDVLIGLRGFNTNTYDTKPPTKLFSAWHANIPFVGGYDSAFTQVGTPGKDYLLAGTPEEAINAVLKLRDRPDIYSELIENSKQRIKEYNEATIAEQWQQVLSGPILQRYELWKSRPEYECNRFNFNQAIGLSEHKLKQVIKKIIKRFKA
ncbi:MAG: hypothetical protein H7Y07_12485 [Pyrinomonadaceae bacterium]|nr:hypothetical protein [Sphingobacteriaceae bacterium]